MTCLLEDLRAALRALRKSPWTSLAVISILGLAIGANTSLVSLLDDVFLHGLPGERPRELVRLYGEAPGSNVTQSPFSVTKFLALREQQRVFEAVAADTRAAFALTGMGEPLQLDGFQVTSNYFDVLGTRPELGRTFRAEEESSGEAVAMVSHELWQHLFAGDPAAVGRAITLNGVPHTIVGVLPPQARAWFGSADVWTTHPFEIPSYSKILLQRGVSFLRVLARARPGVTPAQAEAGLVGIAEGYRAAYPDNADTSWSIRVRTLADDTLGALKPTFSTLSIAVVLLLLIASSNAANLLMVRFRARQSELAVRNALGASGARVVRMLLTECTLLGLGAGGLGIAVALLILRATPLLVSMGLLFAPRVSLQWGAFALGVTLAAGAALLAGLFPALRFAGSDVVLALRKTRASVDRPERRAREVLLGTQAALSFVLLAAALMLVSSLVKLLRAPAGFEPRGMFAAYVALPPARYGGGPEQAAFGERLKEELERAPGVQAAAVVQGLMLTGHDRQSPFARVEGAVPALKDRPFGLVRSITPGFFRALGIELVAGREFDVHDRADAPEVVIVSRSTAHRLFPAEDPLGKHLLLSSQGGGVDVEVVAVVNDVRSVSLGTENEVEFYRPLAQRPAPYLQIAVRASGDDAARAATLRRALAAVDPQLPLVSPGSMSDLVAASLGQRRAVMWLLGAFAGLALLLAAVGVGSVVAHVVARRQAEIGLRLALGATHGRVRGLLIRQGLRPVIWGLGAGLFALFALGPALQTQLYSTRAVDPGMLAGSSALLLSAAWLACWLPARRITRIDPARALRGD